MPSLLRNTLAVIAGFLAGSVANMALVMLGPLLIPSPAGVDVTDAASLAQGIHRFQPWHFIAPFLAHAVGALVGALVAYLLAARYKRAMAWTVGGLFLCGGIAAAFLIPARPWFIAIDLAGAYLPMAWLACRIGARLQRGRDAAAT
jgi:hypothetical protein